MVVRHLGTATFRELVQLSDSWVPTVREFDFSRLLNKYEKKNVYNRRLIVLLGDFGRGRVFRFVYFTYFSCRASLNHQDSSTYHHLGVQGR